MNLMKKLTSCFLLAALSVCAQPALVLKEGEEVQLKFAQPLTSKTAVTDDPVEFTLAEDLKVGEIVVAAAGSKAVGVVSSSRKAGMMGKAGDLSVRVEYLRTDAGKIRLRGSRGREGEGKVGTAVVLTVLFGPIGLIKKGKDIEVKAGTALKVFVADDFPVGGKK